MRYSCKYAKPKIGQKVVGTIMNLIGDSDKCTIMSEVEGSELICITKEIDMQRFKLQTELKSSDDDSDHDSEDSVFERDQNQKEVTLFDQEKNRNLKKGSRIKLQITDVQVSEETLILVATLL